MCQAGIFSDSQVERMVVQWMPRMKRLIERNLGDKYWGKVEADDVLQTVVRTIVRKLRANSFAYDIETEEQLWKIITTITLRRIQCKYRDLHAAKRDISRERNIDGWEGEVLDREANVDNLAGELDEILEVYGSRLREPERRLVDLWLRGLPREEIATELRVSVRTVNRTMERVIEKLRAAIGDWPLTEGMAS